MKKIFLAIITSLFLCSLVQAQTIVANGTRVIDAEKQVCFLTVTESGTDYRYIANTPILSGAPLQTWLDGKVLRFWYSILHTSYPGAEFSTFPGNNKLEQLQAWIAAGHTNSAYCTEESTMELCEINGGVWIPTQVIAKVPWVDSWNLEQVQASEDMKSSVFYNKTDAQINTHIDTQWAAGKQKALFKVLAKEVADIRRQQ